MDVLITLFLVTAAGCMGDTSLHFRVRCSGPGAGGAPECGSIATRHEDVLSPPALMVSMMSVVYYGRVCSYT